MGKISAFAKLTSKMWRGKHVLAENGYFASISARKPIDQNGNPLPWITYCMIELLSEWTNRDMEVFEFGAGYSTLWYASRCRSVTAVEPNPTWAAWVQSRAPGNVKVHLVGTEETDYLAPLIGKYDIVSVDGIHRLACLVKAPDHLKPGGVIILDNVEREEYSGSVQRLKAKGFRRLTFGGLAPANHKSAQKTILLYQEHNVFGI